MEKDSLSRVVTKILNKCYVTRYIIQITFHLLQKHWADTHKFDSLVTHNFDSLVDLIANCGEKEVHQHLLAAPKCPLYIFPLFIAKFSLCL